MPTATYLQGINSLMALQYRIDVCAYLQPTFVGFFDAIN